MTVRLLLALFLLGGAVGCTETLVCPLGETACGGRCVGLLTDGRNCGACGVAVGALQICSAGTPSCAPDATSCGGTCTDLARDADHCGGCSTACGAGELCSTQAGGTCTTTGSCAEGFAACGRACVVLDSDRRNCGACGHACAQGETCREGSCRADLFAACINTNEVVPLTADLAPAGDPRSVPAGPTALALLDGVVLSGNGWPAASVSFLPIDPTHAATSTPLAGTDVENILVHANVLLVSNGETGSVVVLSPGGAVLGEIALPDQQSSPNPHGAAVSGAAAYVALYGTQKIAKLDLSGLAACAAPDPGAPACGGGGACPSGRTCVAGTCRPVCGVVTGTIDLLAIDGAANPPGLPTPSAVVATAGRVYVGLSNLADDPTDPWPFWVIPSGPGKLAVVDPSANDTVTLLALGAGCTKPGPLAVHGSTLWVGCGSLSFPDLAPGALVPVDLSVSPPVAGKAIPVAPIVPGALAFCGGMGYVADQASGSVLRFDPETGTTLAPVTVCAPGPYGFTAVADLACPE